MKKRNTTFIIGAKAFAAIQILTIFVPTWSFAELMTVGDLRSLIESGEIGEVAATAYVQGAVDGLLAMDSLLLKEDGKTPEFCRFFEESKKANIDHPATKTKFLIQMWERSGQPMNTLAVDMVLMYMTAQFGCE